MSDAEENALGETEEEEETETEEEESHLNYNEVENTWPNPEEDDALAQRESQDEEEEGEGMEEEKEEEEEEKEREKEEQREDREEEEGDKEELGKERKDKEEAGEEEEKVREEGEEKEEEREREEEGKMREEGEQKKGEEERGEEEGKVREEGEEKEGEEERGEEEGKVREEGEEKEEEEREREEEGKMREEGEQKEEEEREREEEGKMREEGEQKEEEEREREEEGKVREEGEEKEEEEREREEEGKVREEGEEKEEEEREREEEGKVREEGEEKEGEEERGEEEGKVREEGEEKEEEEREREEEGKMREEGEQKEEEEREREEEGKVREEGEEKEGEEERGEEKEREEEGKVGEEGEEKKGQEEEEEKKKMGEKKEEEGEERQKEEGGEEEEERQWGEAAVMEEAEAKAAATETEAAGVQPGPTAEPPAIPEDKVSTSSHSTISEMFHELRRGSKPKNSLRSESWETIELLRDLNSQYELLDLDQPRSEEQLGKERRDSKTSEGAGAAGTGEKRISYFLSEEEERKFQAQARLAKQSLVSATTEDSLFQKDEHTPVYPLTLTWSYGWNSSLPVYYIRDVNQRVLLYVSAHIAVIYDVFRNSQHHLQGHPNIISCLCVSEDRRWIATADRGPECLIIIWDSFTGIPVHTIFDSCPDGNGIRAIAITGDAKYLATISDAEVQKVCIWKWTLAVETPACTLDLPPEYGLQNYLTFNPTNNKELVSNSKTQAIYYSWYEEREMLAYSAPILTEKTFNKLVGKFSQSVFHLNLTQILSATMEGKLVVWDIHRPPPSCSAILNFPYIKPCKLVHLQKEGITVLTTVDSYIVTGDIRGNIKFYDRTLSIVNWYSHFKLSSIRTLSFSKTPASPPSEKSNLPPDCTLKGDLFVVRNFIIATSDATVYHLTTDGTKLDKLFTEPKDAIYAISCHPYQPFIAIGSACGIIKVWDYETKKYLFSRVFEKGLGVQSLTYNPEGALLGAGFTEGTVYILDAMSLENESPKPFKYSRTSVTHVSFSHDSQYMATADVSFTVAVYKVVVRKGQRVWEYLARLRSHRKTIRSLLFGVHLDSNEPRLLSLGADRLLIEYNLTKSYRDHLEVLDVHRTDQGNYPTCMVWYPPLVKELFLLICNSGYKMKLFNSTTKMCRKTLLGPTYGSPVQQTQVLPVRSAIELQKRYLVFINKDKVGLQILPVDGNPHKTCAIICHPSGVAGMALSYDGCSAFTAGGQDRSVVQWKINLSALDAAVSLGGEDLTPFYGLVSGGREGKFYRELEDYFYYSQLRSQGIDTMDRRKVSEHICLSELPFVMRAIGFYPTEEKIEDMFNEIRFSEYVDTGKLIDKINLPDFFKVYLNHRPPFGNTMTGIQESFDVLGFTNSEGKKAIRREEFLKLLQTKGEHMTPEETADCFATLFGLNPEGWKSEPAASSVRGSEICLEEELPDEITAEIFTTEILGLTISENSRQDGQ